MRILQVGKYYPPVRGGMETVLRHTCEGLLAAGHEVTALVAGTAPRDRREPLRAGGAAGAGSGGAAVPGAAAHEGAAAGRLIRAGRLAVFASQPLCPRLPALLRAELGRPPDLVQLHLPDPAACAAWLAVAGPQAPPLAIWYHADITRQRLGRRLVRPVVERCLARAAGIAVSSEALREGSAWLRPHAARVTVIPFGIDPGPPPARTADAAAPFLFVGRLVYYKGLDVLLAALARVPEGRLAIVGAGPLRPAVEREVRRSGLGARVELLGEVDEPGLRRLLLSARALVLPSVSTSETFGLVQLEAMAAGLPVVSTRLPTGVAEVNLDGVTGRVVPPGDPAALAAALRELLAEPERARAWGQAGRRRVEQAYGRERMVRDLLRWYEGILGARPAAARGE